MDINVNFQNHPRNNSRHTVARMETNQSNTEHGIASPDKFGMEPVPK